MMDDEIMAKAADLYAGPATNPEDQVLVDLIFFSALNDDDDENE